MKSQEELATPHYDVIAVDKIIAEAEPLDASDTAPENTPSNFFNTPDIPEAQRHFHAPPEKQKVGRKLGSLLTGRALIQTTANVHETSGFDWRPTTYGRTRGDEVHGIKATRETLVGKRNDPDLQVTSMHTAKTRSQDAPHKTKVDTAELTETKTIGLRDSLSPSKVERKVTYDGNGNVQVVQEHTTETGRVNERVWSSDEKSMHYDPSARKIASAVQKRVRASTKHGAPSGIGQVRSRVDARTLGIARAKAKRGGKITFK